MTVDSQLLLRGHSAPVVSLDVLESRLASSSLDGSVRVWDLRVHSKTEVATVLDLRAFALASEEQCGEFEDVGVVRFHPLSASSLFAAVGRFLLKFDLRKTDSPVEATSTLSPYILDSQLLFAGRSRPRKGAIVETGEGDVSDFEINDFDLWVPSPQERRRLLLSAAGQTAGKAGKPSKGKAHASVSSSDEYGADATLPPVCFALPFDSGDVKVALEKPRQHNGKGGGEMLALEVESIPLPYRHFSICGVARFRQTRVLDLISGGYDSQLLTHDIFSGKGRCSFDMQRLTGAKSVLPKTKTPHVGVGSEKVQILNPPFVTSLAVHGGNALVAAGLGSGSVFFFRYSDSERNARLSPLLDFPTHGAAVTQLRFASQRQLEGKEFLFTCGDDSSLCLIALQASFCSAGKLEEGHPQICIKKRLPFKPNALAVQTESVALRVFVGDVSPDIKVFDRLDEIAVKK